MFMLGAEAAPVSNWVISPRAILAILQMVLGLTLLFSCVLLFRKERWSSWMMLAGATGGLLFIPETREMLASLTGYGMGNDLFAALTIFVGFGCLCLLLVGFLLHALHHRAAMRRITELETIIADQQDRMVSRK